MRASASLSNPVKQLAAPDRRSAASRRIASPLTARRRHRRHVPGMAARSNSRGRRIDRRAAISARALGLRAVQRWRRAGGRTRRLTVQADRSSAPSCETALSAAGRDRAMSPPPAHRPAARRRCSRRRIPDERVRTARRGSCGTAVGELPAARPSVSADRAEDPAARARPRSSRARARVKSSPRWPVGWRWLDRGVSFATRGGGKTPSSAPSSRRRPSRRCSCS